MVNTKTHILLVDDDYRLCRWLRLNLEAEHYRVRTARSGEIALALMEREIPQLVLLDVMLPGMSGTEFLKRLRLDHSMPVIMLSAKNDQDELTRSLHSGADDYVTKPFNMAELLARIEAVLRRSASSPNYPVQRVVEVGDMKIDLGRRQVTVRGKDPGLTSTEYKLLAELAAHPGQVITHRELLSKVWGPAYGDEWEYIRTYMGRLRRKIETDPANPEYILSKHGFGYYLRSEEAPEAFVATGRGDKSQRETAGSR